MTGQQQSNSIAEMETGCKERGSLRSRGNPAASRQSNEHSTRLMLPRLLQLAVVQVAVRDHKPPPGQCLSC